MYLVDARRALVWTRRLVPLGRYAGDLTDSEHVSEAARRLQDKEATTAPDKRSLTSH